MRCHPLQDAAVHSLSDVGLGGVGRDRQTDVHCLFSVWAFRLEGAMAQAAKSNAYSDRDVRHSFLC